MVLEAAWPAMMVMVVLRIPMAVRTMRIRAGIHLMVVVRLTAGVDMLLAGFHDHPGPGHKAAEQAEKQACKKAADDQQGHAELQGRIEGSVKGPLGRPESSARQMA